LVTVTESSASSSSPNERLDSWKEIARYLDRDESTVQRWEKREGMPVHRHVHSKRGSVYAYRAELDAWWQGRRQQLEPPKIEGQGSTAELEPSAAPGPFGIAPSARPRRWGLAVVALTLAMVALLAWRWMPWSGAPRPVATPALVRLTSTSGLNADPALSRDGSLLAYASDRGSSGELDIWVQPIGEERPRRVTSESGDELEPSFSPTGESIVFAKGEAGGIYVVSVDGGAPRPLVPTARSRTPRFSPDGHWVTYWTGLPVWVGSVMTGTAAGGTASLFVVPAHGGTPRQLAPDFAHARFGTWAPHGKTVLFLGARERDPDPSSMDWYVVGAETGEPIKTGAREVLRRSGVKGVPIPGAWSSDGVVTFATYDEGAGNVWQLAIDPGAGRVVGEPARLTFGTAVERSPATSAGRIVFTNIAENIDIWRLPLDPATGLAGGAIERVTDNVARDQLWHLSDDGRTMAFVSSRSGQDDVWIRDMRAGRDRQVTHSNARGVRISRDGARLAVTRGSLERPGTDLVSTAGRSPASPLCDDCVPGDWSPDGTKLVVQRGQPSRLVVRDLASGRDVELARHPTWNLFQPRFSPDGRWVVFHTTNSPSLRQIYAVPASTPVPVPLDQWVAIAADFGVQPSWASDGSGVYHFSLRDGAFCAWLQVVDPGSARPVGSPRPVQHFHQRRLRAATAAIATNDVAAGYLYVTLTSSAANIWMLQR
jgi:Tol biopolymer transport system component